MKPLLVICSLAFFLHTKGQSLGSSRYLSFSDVSNFWQAYDRVIKTGDSSEQVKIIQSVYFNKASMELHLLQKLFHHSAADYLAYIKADPRFWRGLRERSRVLMFNYKKIDEALRKLKAVYRPLEIPEVVFMIGCFEFGGRPMGDKVMISLEVALADGNFDVPPADGSDDNYQQYPVDAAIYFALHEVMHTNQPMYKAQDLLSLCVMEGSCDFIAELVMAKPLQRPYITLGNHFEKKIWESFKKEMNGFTHDDWLYNRGFVTKGEEDLGYFVGYAICKYFYQNASNKRNALRRIVNLDYSSNNEVYKFFLRSGYEKKPMANN